jgi:hypothetical protein
MRERSGPPDAAEHLTSGSAAAVSRSETGGSHGSGAAMATPIGVTTVAQASRIGGWLVRMILAPICLMVHMSFARDCD